MKTTAGDLEERARGLLPSVLALDPLERGAFLDRACAKQPTLRREVEALLAVEEAGTGPIDCPSPASPRDQLPDQPMPQSIGPYKVVRELGRGGSSVVYLAIRADGEYRREVAVKVLRPGWNADDWARRFRAERQILANLRHPNIAVLYDGGTTKDERPYFVLEYVNGVPIDIDCASRRLTVSQRLDLFLDIASAVHHAHQRLVIHRDLKPANILVDARGTPKLLDFGIAKWLTPSRLLPARSTRPGWRPMTPEYASPEQLLGTPITTATDVYGLGLVLYELLAGQRPFDVGEILDFEAQQVILGQSPVAPSRVVARRGGASRWGGSWRSRAGARSLDASARQLTGDLDTVVLKALAKDPARRYPTVEQMADDVRRHLKGLPIHARPPAWHYRFGKLVGRRKGVASTLLVLALATAGFAVAHEAKNRQVIAALRRAETGSRVLAEMILVTTEQSDRNRDLIPREFLDRGQEALNQQVGASELRAELMAAVGHGYLKHAEFDRAKGLVRRAYYLRRHLYGDNDERVVASLRDLAHYESARSRPRRAESLYRAALRIERQRLGDDDAGVARLRNAVAATLFDQGRSREAEPLYRRALETLRHHLGDDSIDAAALRNNLARALLDQGKLPEAESMLRRALKVTRVHLRDNDGLVMANQVNLAAVLRADGRLEDAEAMEREVLARHRQSGRAPAVANVAERLAQTLMLGSQVTEAEALAHEAVQIHRDVFGVHSFPMASSATTLAEILLARGRSRDAETVLESSIQTFERLGLEDHWRMAEARSLLGTCRFRAGQRAEARSLMTSSLADLRHGLGDAAPATRAARRRLARLSADHGRDERVVGPGV